VGSPSGQVTARTCARLTIRAARICCHAAVGGWLPASCRSSAGVDKGAQRAAKEPGVSWTVSTLAHATKKAAVTDAGPA
jgi:hypothetical protein